MTARKRKKSGTGKWGVLLLIIGAVAAFSIYKAYNVVYQANVQNIGKPFIYLKSNASYEENMQAIKASGVIRDFESFEFLAERKKYRQSIKPGRYELQFGMGNNAIINHLRSGQQSPVKLKLNMERSLPEIAGAISRQLEPDSSAFLALLNNEDTAAFYGFKPATFIAMFMPNTYEFYWATPARKVLGRFKSEYDKFWTPERKAKAEVLGMSQDEVSTLAAIVQKETIKRNEAPTIAGVYMNRLKNGIPLQADPTLVYASGNFDARRVLNAYKQIDSPYNTYKYKGLPPGPICLPAGLFIDAVLNYEKHNYLYFCAKEDFSGYSNFAASYAQHQVNAKKYQQALDRRGILN